MTLSSVPPKRCEEQSSEVDINTLAGTVYTLEQHYLEFQPNDYNVGVAYFDTQVAFGSDVDVAFSYGSGKGIIHIVHIGSEVSILRGVQVGEEIPLVYEHITGGNGNHLLKVTNVGNTIDIQLKTLKTKLFGGL